MNQYSVAALRLSCLVFFALILLRTWVGPVSGIVSARSTLNFAAFGLLSLVALLLLRKVESEPISVPSSRVPSWLIYATLAIATICPYLPSISNPFLFDDYVHLASASAAPSLLARAQQVFLEHPGGGDGFFRPIGALYFWMIWQWAGRSLAAWHFSGLAIHTANTLLAYSFLRRMTGAMLPAFGGALFFAWHASHVEAVCWTAASFDLLAAFFSLLTLILVTDPNPTLLRTAAAMLTAGLACLSKESAYCLPLLIACLSLFYKGAVRRRMLLASVYAALACTVAFVYRIWYLQGVGGYRTATGSPMILSWHPTSAIQGLLLRLWALLFLPLNWSAKPELWLSLAATLMLVSFMSVSVLNCRRSATSVNRLYASLLFTLCAALPVFPLLLVGSDLAGARILYLPSLGASLFLSVAVGSEINSRNSRIPLVCVVSVLLFQLTALLHNEFIWRGEARLASQACLDVADVLKHNPASHVYAIGLPRTRNGVFFLGNGFSECVALVGGDQSTQSRVTVGAPPPSAPSNGYVVRWDDKTAKLQEVGLSPQ